MYPLVSIIIPVFNVQSYLCECIDSVITQTYNNLEIIIVDDGSTDDSGTICDNYQRMDSRIRVIHQENRGLSAARNTALDIISGDLVLFLDSDDAFLPDMIKTMVKSQNDFQTDMTICGYYSCQTTGRMTVDESTAQKLVEEGVYSSKNVLELMMTDKLNMFMWNKMYAASLFKSLRFPDGCVYEDMYLMPFIVEEAKTVLVIKQPLVFYRRRSDSISSTFSEEYLSNWLYALKAREKFIEDRTPSFFTDSLKEKVFESDFKYIMNHYAVLFSNRLCSSSVKVLFKKELQLRKRNVKLKSFKAKMRYYMIIVNPFLYSSTRCFYHNTKRFFHAFMEGINFSKLKP